jgi:hypothetical protein
MELTVLVSILLPEMVLIQGLVKYQVSISFRWFMLITIGLFGTGIYFADAFQKSIGYNRGQLPSKPGFVYKINDLLAGEHCMLLCRVTLGASYVSSSPQPHLRLPPVNTSTGLIFDSVVGQLGLKGKDYSQRCTNS